MLVSEKIQSKPDSDIKKATCSECSFVLRCRHFSLYLPIGNQTHTYLSPQVSPSYPIMSKITCQIAIVGCGLGGLAAAIALRRQGHDVIMLDQAAQLSEVCALINHAYLS